MALSETLIVAILLLSGLQILHGAEQKWAEGHSKAQVVTVVAGTGSAAVAESPKPVQKCENVCNDECSQRTDKKCETVPFTEQACFEVPYSENATTCQKQCVQVAVAAPAAAAVPVVAAAPVPVVAAVDPSVGQAVAVPYNAPQYGHWKGLRRLLGAKESNKAFKGSAPAPAPTVVAPTYVAAASYATYVAAQTALQCNDVCVTVPVMKSRIQCQQVEKKRTTCTDFYVTTCKKVCKPVCTDQAPATNASNSGK